MPFTKEELAAMAAADAEIEAGFMLTRADLELSRQLDRAAVFDAMDNKERIVAARWQRYHQKHREEINARQRAYYAANREEILGQQHEYYKANTENIRARQRAYRETNREKLIDQQRAYYQANRGEINAKRRAQYAVRRKKGGAGMTQTGKVLRHLEQTGSITPLEALEQYGCMRLGARIWDLKHMGYPIKTEIVTGKNRDGDTVKYARYSMEVSE